MIEYSRVRKIHFVGIGGAGMSGIAEVLHNMGFVVSGSDIAEGDTINRLRSMGIDVFLGHRKDNVADAETLVYSSAVTPDNVEVKEALKRKIPVIPRAEMLAELMRVKFSVAVAGTHGKTTTTSMIATILSHASKDPTFVVGGKLKTGESGAKLGKSAYLIAEADESDGSFLSLFPTIAVITNIEDDHLDYYQNMDRLRESFLQFGNKVPFYGSVILNYDCSHSRQILPHLNKRVLTYSLSADTDIRVENIKNSLFGTAFDLFILGEYRGRMELNVGGIHNIYNALAAITAAVEIGIDMPVIQEGLKKFYLPERRFQVLFYSPDYLVVDDYAHHPSEIKTTVDTLKLGDFKRIVAIFQPHRFSRLQILMEKFASAFQGVDRLIVARIYAANQKEIENVDGKILAEKIRGEGLQDVRYIEELEDIIGCLRQEMQKGDAFLFLSAGDLTRTAHRFAEVLEKMAGRKAGSRR
jgi:UDP-N-acetylmuramate--alanine ligase